MAVLDEVSSLTILTLKVTGLRVVIIIDDTTFTDQTSSLFDFRATCSHIQEKNSSVREKLENALWKKYIQADC